MRLRRETKRGDGRGGVAASGLSVLDVAFGKKMMTERTLETGGLREK